MMMGKKSLYLLLITAILLAGCQGRGYDSYYLAGPQKRMVNLAIIPFEDIEQPQRAARLTADLRRELAARHRVTLVDEGALEKLLREQEVPAGVFLEPAAARALGQQLSSDLVLTARIKEFRFEEQVNNVPLLWSRTRYLATYRVDLSLVKVQRTRHSTQEIAGKAELTRREIQLFYLGTEGNFQFISAEEKQRVKEQAYENLIEELIKVVLS